LSFSAIRPSSGSERASIFRIALLRWTFTVASAMPISPAICLLSRPRATRIMIVSVEAAYELRRHAEPIRLTALAAFAYLRGRSLTDSLVDLWNREVGPISCAECR